MTRRTKALVTAATFAVAAILAGGCAGEDKPPPNLPLACETSKCTCVETDRAFWQSAKEAPVEWKPSGEAFCPEGYELQRTKK